MTTYNPTTQLWEPYPGVECVYTPPGPVQTDFLFAPFVQHLATHGYTNGKDMVEFPYDWRVGPNEMRARQFPLLKGLIEATYAANGNAPCALVSYSQGGPYVLLFLNLQSAAWKSQFIHSWTSYAGAFGGTEVSISRVISNWQPDHFKWLPLHLYHQLAQSLGTTVWNLPYTETFGTSMMLVQTPKRQYTTSDVSALLLDAGAALSVKILADIKVYQTNMPAPGVATNCVFGYNVNTIVNMTYSTNDFEDDFVGGWSMDGDDCLLVEALDQCKNWAPTNVKPAVAFQFSGVAHGDLTYSTLCRNVLWKAIGVPIETGLNATLSARPDFFPGHVVELL